MRPQLQHRGLRGLLQDFASPKRLPAETLITRGVHVELAQSGGLAPHPLSRTDQLSTLPPGSPASLCVYAPARIALGTPDVSNRRSSCLRGGAYLRSGGDELHHGHPPSGGTGGTRTRDPCQAAFDALSPSELRCRVPRRRGIWERRGLGDETLSSGIYLPRFSPQINISFMKIRPLFPHITWPYQNFPKIPFIKNRQGYLKALPFFFRHPAMLLRPACIVPVRCCRTTGPARRP